MSKSTHEENYQAALELMAQWVIEEMSNESEDQHDNDRDWRQHDQPAAQQIMAADMCVMR
jgi:hypothetical protein